MKTPIVFVVDKNPVHLSLINYYLIMNRFFHVYTFPSGGECLYRLKRQFIPDFIITDYNPADYDGFDFVRTVKEISPYIRVIFFSSIDDPAIALRLFEAGASDYVIKTGKPNIGITELIRNIRYLLKEMTLP